MKSFFKKLAFVMALAMVVTLAAPAAQSALAANVITYARQAETEKVTALEMKVNETVDLKFLGAPANWKTVGFKWESTNEAVATVDQTGVITAMADGTALIKCTIGDSTTEGVVVTVGNAMKVVLGTSKTDVFSEYTLEIGKEVDLAFYGVTDWNGGKNYNFAWTSSNPEVATVDARTGLVTAVKAGTATVTLTLVNKTTGVPVNAVPVVVTVPSPAVDLSYTVRQVSDTAVDLVFNDAVTLTKDQITLYQVYDGNIEVSWPIKDFDAKDNKITIKPYVAFGNAENYVVKVTSEATEVAEAFTTSIGLVDRVTLAFKSLNADGKAYTNGEDGDEIPVSITPTLYSNGVDVTNVYGTDNVSYELAMESDYAYITNDYGVGEIVFRQEKLPVTVIATYTGEDADGESYTKSGMGSIVSEAAPAYKLTSIEGWTIVKAGDESKIDWSKPVHDIAAYDDSDDYYIVAVVKDSYGNLSSTSDAYSTDKIKAYSSSVMAEEGYEIEFSSSNVEKLLVDADGYLTTYTKANVAIIVGVYNDELSTREDGFIRNLSALTVQVKDARKLDKVTVAKTSVDLLTRALAADTEFTKVKVYISSLDQYGNACDNGGYSVSTTDKILSGYNFNACIGHDNDGDYILLNGEDIVLLEPKSTSFTLTIKETGSGKTATLKVNLRKPSLKNDQVSVSKYSLSVSDVDVCKKEDKGTGSVDVSTGIKYVALSNNYAVGYYDQVELITNADFLKNLTSSDIYNPTGSPVATGDKFLAVYAPDGSLVTSGITANGDGTFTFAVATENGTTGEMTYAKMGAYTVRIVEVTSVNATTGKVITRTTSSNTAKFTVSNTSNQVSFVKQKELASTATTIADIVKETLQFNLGTSEWKDDLSTAFIDKVEGRINANSDYIIITKVTFKIPVDGKTGTAGYAYYTGSVNVNKAVKAENYNGTVDVNGVFVD